ncbi:hypothetical protein GCM10012286_36960 [Streptomyces lasiicapitis]|uniref:Uncharacterized protein n=1 Tax=Streptomyces lasiicapitis TaxID=1923961 RepID=A0ABQ2M3J8_9ACTN|nr:hypothetical protein GCM10012286_36960 [Streptomyces lasiicapitis]
MAEAGAHQLRGQEVRRGGQRQASRHGEHPAHQRPAPTPRPACAGTYEPEDRPRQGRSQQRGDGHECREGLPEPRGGGTRFGLGAEEDAQGAQTRGHEDVVVLGAVDVLLHDDGEPLLGSEHDDGLIGGRRTAGPDHAGVQVAEGVVTPGEAVPLLVVHRHGSGVRLTDRLLGQHVLFRAQLDGGQAAHVLQGRAEVAVGDAGGVEGGAVALGTAEVVAVAGC